MARSSDVAVAFLAALQRGDADSLRQLVTDDVVEVLPFAASGGSEPAAVFEGRDAFLNVQHVIMESFERVEFLDPIVTEAADGQTVFVESSGRRVQNGTGAVYENLYVLKLELRDGLIWQITEYSNPVTFAMFFDQPIG